VQKDSKPGDYIWPLAIAYLFLGTLFFWLHHTIQGGLWVLLALSTATNHVLITFASNPDSRQVYIARRVAPLACLGCWLLLGFLLHWRL
jgi:hypothetical protein